MLRASVSRNCRFNRFGHHSFGAFRSFSMFDRFDKSDNSFSFACRSMLANAYAKNHKCRGDSLLGIPKILLPEDHVQLKVRKEEDKVIVSVGGIRTQDMAGYVTTKDEMSKFAVVRVGHIYPFTSYQAYKPILRVYRRPGLPLWDTFTILTPLFDYRTQNEWLLEKYLVERGQELMVNTDVAVFCHWKKFGPLAAN